MMVSTLIAMANHQAEIPNASGSVVRPVSQDFIQSLKPASAPVFIIAADSAYIASAIQEPTRPSAERYQVPEAQPPAKIMPNPNRKPPTTTAPGANVLYSGEMTPVEVSAASPTAWIEMTISSATNVRQERCMKMSRIMPVTQNLPRCITTPSTAPTTKPVRIMGTCLSVTTGFELLKAYEEAKISPKVATKILTKRHKTWFMRRFLSFTCRRCRRMIVGCPRWWKVSVFVYVVLAAVPVGEGIELLLTRLPAWVPPVAGVATAIAVGLGVLDANVDELAGTVGDSLVTMLKVLAIIGGGVTLARTMDRTGAQKQLADWLAAGGASLGSALLMANGVVPFMEAVTGFGVSLIIGLPLTLAFGFNAYHAALITLMGIAIGPWGSMGPGTLLGAELAGQSLTGMG